MPIARSIAAIAFAALLAAPALAQHHHGGHGGVIAVENAWARATPPMAKTGAVYVTIRNNGPMSDRLVAASTPVAGTAELHTHIHEGNVMRMRKVESVPVEAGKTVAFAPGSLHVMLIGLKAPLKQGASVPLSLTFEKAGEISVSATVLGVGAAPPAPAEKSGAPSDAPDDGHQH